MRSRSVAASICTLCALGLALAACGPWVPLPPPGSHEGDEPVIVPSTPPPPQVELIPDRPKGQPNAVWVDGQWLWRGRRWEWDHGRWEVPRPGATYAPPAVVYLADNRIAWFPGRWR
jgi:hypothetical protein